MDFAPFPSIRAKSSALRAPQLTRASDGGAALPPTSSPGAWGSATRLAGLVRVLCVRLPAAVPFPCASDDSADVFGGARDLQRRREQHVFTTPSKTGAFKANGVLKNFLGPSRTFGVVSRLA